MEYIATVVFRAWLDWMNFIRILKESNFSLTSHGVWNGGMKFSFPMEMLAFLHEMKEIKH
jgi:hypothetical protein